MNTTRKTFGAATTEGAEMETWFYRLPRAARIAVNGALVFVAFFGAMQLETLDAGGRFSGSALIYHAVLSAAVGLIGGVVAVVLGEQRVRRIFGSFEQGNAYRRALRTGELPAHIDPAVWRGWLSVSQRAMRWWPISIVSFAVIGVLEVLTYLWAHAVVFGVLVIWYGIWWRVQQGQISRLTLAVEQRAAAAQAA
jgi:hypothetical protein